MGVGCALYSGWKGADGGRSVSTYVQYTEDRLLANVSFAERVVRKRKVMVHSGGARDT